MVYRDAGRQMYDLEDVSFFHPLIELERSVFLLNTQSVPARRDIYIKG